MAASSQTLMEEFEASKMEKDKLEYQDKFRLTTVLSLLANQDSNSDERTNFMLFENECSTSSLKLTIDTLKEK